jgi:hypothetical protein
MRALEWQLENVMGRKALQFAAILLTALALVPAGAHFFALPNKIGMARDAYFTAQQIYAGWALFGIVLFGALVANLALSIRLRGQRPAFFLALFGAIAFVVVLAIFFTWTFPANQATANWTSQPENWELLRRQWEYSHAVNAIVTFLALCAVTLAALTARD